MLFQIFVIPDFQYFIHVKSGTNHEKSDILVNVLLHDLLIVLSEIQYVNIWFSGTIYTENQVSVLLIFW